MTKTLLQCMAQTLSNEYRVPFPEKEAFYQNAHRHIHYAIDLFMPEHKVANVRDSQLVGGQRIAYVEVYKNVYDDKVVRSTLEDAEDIDASKTLIFGIVTDKIQLFTEKKISGAVVSNALHDALHDVLTDLQVRDISPDVKILRMLFRVMYYEFLFFGNNDKLPVELYGINEVVTANKLEDLKFVLEQLEIDIGISSKYYLETLMSSEKQ